MVKDSVLLLLWLRFDPWLQNLCMLQVRPIHTHTHTHRAGVSTVAQWVKNPPAEAQVAEEGLILGPAQWVKGSSITAAAA